MPYMLDLLEAVAFTLAGAVATLITALVTPFRGFLAFAWRMWFWGTVGLLAGTLLPLVVFFPCLLGVGITGAPSGHTDVSTLILTDVILFGPLVLSTLGILLGCLYGWQGAQRRIARLGV